MKKFALAAALVMALAAPATYALGETVVDSPFAISGAVTAVMPGATMRMTIGGVSYQVVGVVLKLNGAAVAATAQSGLVGATCALSGTKSTTTYKIGNPVPAPTNTYLVSTANCTK